MNNMPINLRNQCETDPYYQNCARSNYECAGRITWEHALLYVGKQIQEKFSVLPLCEYHHLGKGMKKKYNEIIALSRATKEDKLKYPDLKWHIYER